MSEEIEEEGTIEIRYRIYCNIPRLEKVRIFGEISTTIIDLDFL